MPEPQHLVTLYMRLAQHSQHQIKPLQRDKFLVLALESAYQAGQKDLAEQIRQQILRSNPNHLLRPYPSVTAAMESDDIQTYLHQLRRMYPFEKAEYLLHRLEAIERSTGGADSAEGASASKPAGADQPAWSPGPPAGGAGDAASTFPRLNLDITPPRPIQPPRVPLPVVSARRPTAQERRPAGTGSIVLFVLVLLGVVALLLSSVIWPILH